jgi:hypothetical protein
MVSATDDHHHRLEADILGRVGGLGQPHRVFETVVDGDIALRTDGGTFGDGVLYEVEFDAPGRFAVEIGATTVPLAPLNSQRTAISDPDCT